MGGPASPLCWTIGYDPVVWALSQIIGRRCPTYVDDLAALLAGPRETALASVSILAAGHCAGLRIETHSCQWLRATRLHPEDFSTLEALTAPRK